MLGKRNDQPLQRQLEHNQGQRTEPSLPPQSTLGKVSFFLGLTSILMIVVFECVLPIGVLMIGDHTDLNLPFSDILFGTVAPLGFIASPITSRIGFSLGIAALIRKNYRRGFAVAGVFLNFLILFVFVLILLWWMSAIEQMIAI